MQGGMRRATKNNIAGLGNRFVISPYKQVRNNQTGLLAIKQRMPVRSTFPRSFGVRVIRAAPDCYRPFTFATRISGYAPSQSGVTASKISLKSCPSPGFKGAAETGSKST